MYIVKHYNSRTGFALKTREAKRLSVDLLPDFHEEVKSMAKSRQRP
ncbi:MAG: hypothetical protein OXC82_04210 [Rhodobacteraceae bacterium]|nr:hypothetical protein [Paracoccaceae bacterium]MCY4249625.1 hypothetical protein [Paracoccaceae bacterium]MCY4308857.1 hypothetical protein [Paracoccaceae bacterium]